MVTTSQRATRVKARSLELPQDLAQVLPKKLPQIKLRYGQVMWLLTELGCGDAVSRSAFHEYMKSLCKLGIPFGQERFQTKHRRRLAEHSYCHVMELAVVLSLRVYHVVPDSLFPPRHSLPQPAASILSTSVCAALQRSGGTNCHQGR